MSASRFGAIRRKWRLAIRAIRDSTNSADGCVSGRRRSVGLRLPPLPGARRRPRASGRDPGGRRPSREFSTSHRHRAHARPVPRPGRPRGAGAGCPHPRPTGDLGGRACTPPPPGPPPAVVGGRTAGEAPPPRNLGAVPPARARPLCLLSLPISLSFPPLCGDAALAPCHFFCRPRAPRPRHRPDAALGSALSGTAYSHSGSAASLFFLPLSPEGGQFLAPGPAALATRPLSSDAAGRRSAGRFRQLW